MSGTTWASRAAVAVTAALAILQAWWAWGGGSAATAAVLAPMTLLAAVALLRVNRLETRMAVVMAAFAQIGLTSLSLLLGLPGQTRDHPDTHAVTALLVPLAVLVLIDCDRRARTVLRAGSTDPEVWPPYAR